MKISDPRPFEKRVFTDFIQIDADFTSPYIGTR